MAKEDKPLEYQRRLRDTKGVAQRLDLDYLKRPAILGHLRKRLTWAVVAAAVLACVPLVLGVGGSRGAAAFESRGPHALRGENASGNDTPHEVRRLPRHGSYVRRRSPAAGDLRAELQELPRTGTGVRRVPSVMPRGWTRAARQRPQDHS